MPKAFCLFPDSVSGLQEKLLYVVELDRPIVVTRNVAVLIERITNPSVSSSMQLDSTEYGITPTQDRSLSSLEQLLVRSHSWWSLLFKTNESCDALVSLEDAIWMHVRYHGDLIA